MKVTDRERGAPDVRVWLNLSDLLVKQPAGVKQRGNAYSFNMKRSIILFQDFDHPLFQEIDRKKATYKSGVVKVYVVEDPINSDHLLYLTKADYLKLLSVGLSNDTPILVLVAPGDSLNRPDPEK